MGSACRVGRKALPLLLGQSSGAVPGGHPTIQQPFAALLADVAKSDAALACSAGPGGRACEACWSAELARALESIGSASGLGDQGRSWADKVKQGLPLGCRASVLDATLAAYDKLACVMVRKGWFAVSCCQKGALSGRPSHTMHTSSPRNLVRFRRISSSTMSCTSRSLSWQGLG